MDGANDGVTVGENVGCSVVGIPVGFVGCMGCRISVGGKVTSSCEGVNEGCNVGFRVSQGDSVGVIDGTPVRSSEGINVGVIVGAYVYEMVVGTLLGSNVGNTDGVNVGTIVGIAVGTNVGETDGAGDGLGD